MTESTATLLELVGVLGVAMGLLGALLPGVPGAPLIWLGAALWAWGDGFNRIGWPTLAFLGVLAVTAEIAELAVTSWSARRGGVPWRSLAIATLAGLAAGLVFSLPGLVFGAFAGLLVVEYRRNDGDWRRTLRGGGAVAAGWLVAMGVQLAASVAMVAVFVWQAFSP